MTFEEFTADRLPRLLRFAGVLTGDRGLAEDVVQEVLFRASKRWTTIAAADAPDAYVRRMIVNEYISWRRKWARIVPRAEVMDERETPDYAVQYADRDELSRRLDRLPVRQRTVLVLRYYEGLADDAIAVLMQCSTGTVRSHASRGLAALRIDADTESLVAASSAARSTSSAIPSGRDA